MKNRIPAQFTIVTRSFFLCLPVALGGFSITGAQDKPAVPMYYEDDVAASNPLRTEQAKELDDYVVALKRDNGRLQKLFQPDYSSPSAFEKSAEPYRSAFCESIGYPPPGDAPSDAATFDKIGEDSIGNYFRAKIPILPGVHAEGIYIVPQGIQGRAPLVISMHGGGGSPEVALFRGGANYHDMVRGGVKRGYVVFAPQHLFSADGFPKDLRNRTDERLPPATIPTISSRSPSVNGRVANSDGATASPLCSTTTLRG